MIRANLEINSIITTKQPNQTICAYNCLNIFRDIRAVNPETLSSEICEKICQNMPNHSGNIRIGENSYPSSIMELSNPTGKYVYRIFFKLLNLYSQKGIIRIIGNNCAPGLSFPQLISGQGISQFEGLTKSCPILVANILGDEKFPDSVTVPAEPFMVVPVDSSWDGFDDYLKAFSSKYRVRANKVLQSSEAFTVEELSTKPSNEWIAPCGALLHQTLQDKTIAIGKNLPELIHCYKKALGENYRVFGYYLNDELMGFISCITGSDTLYAMQLGMSNSAPVDSKLYQRMLLDITKLGIENKYKFINLGRTGTEIKSTLGASPINNSFVIFTRSKVALFIFNLYLKYIHKTPQYTIRKPFK